MEYVRDVIVSLSALAVALFAWIGLRAWRKELLGKEKFETARRMMRVCLKLESDLSWLRFVITEDDEFADRVHKSSETVAETSLLDEWYAKSKRLEPVMNSMGQLTEIQWQAEILFDEVSFKNVNDAIQVLRGIYYELYSAVSSYFTTRLEEVRTEVLYRDQERLQRLRDKIYLIEDDDYYSNKVDSAIDSISSVLKKYVK